MTKDILEINIKKIIECSKEVAFWNYWDHEHLDVVHGGYAKSDIPTIKMIIYLGWI